MKSLKYCFPLVICLLLACRSNTTSNGTAIGTASDTTQPTNTPTNQMALTGSSGDGSVVLDSIVFDKEYGDCAGENPCVRISTRTIQVKSGVTVVVQEAINHDLRLATASFLVVGEEKAADQPIADIGETIRKDFEENGKEFNMSWEYEVASTVALNAQHLLSVDVGGMTFTGGAHPNHANTLLFFDTRTGKRLTLADVLVPTYRPRLMQLIDQKLRQLYEIPAGIDLTEHGFMEKNIEPTENFMLTSQGITLHYSPYEIAPYVMGHIVVEIPFADINDLLKTDGAASTLAN